MAAGTWATNSADRQYRLLALGTRPAAMRSRRHGSAWKTSAIVAAVRARSNQRVT
jgi:hypothetical protein